MLKYVNHSYYEAYEAKYNGEQYMAKMTDPNKYSAVMLLKQEKEFLQAVHLDHSCIAQFLAAFDKPKPLLLMERMWMNLTGFLDNKKQLDDHKNSILCNAACGLHYIHKKGIIHCDLTADSIWLTENMKAKLSDFGRAIFSEQNIIRYSPENTDHMPPEIFECYSKINYSTKVDVFSFGCVIIHTFTHEHPTPDFDKYVRTSEIGKYIKHSEISRRSVCLKKFKHTINSIKLHDIVLTCLHDSPDHRPTAAALLSSLEEQITLNVTNTFKFGMLNNYNFLVNLKSLIYINSAFTHK